MAGSSWRFWCAHQLGELCAGRPALRDDARGCAGLGAGLEPSRGWGLSVCVPRHGMVQPCPAGPHCWHCNVPCAPSCPMACNSPSPVPSIHLSEGRGCAWAAQESSGVPLCARGSSLSPRAPSWAPPAAPCIPLGPGLQLRPVGSRSSAAPSCLPLSPAFLIREALESLPLSLTSRGRQSEREFGWEITHQGSCLLCRASNQLRNNNCITKIS